MELLPDNVKEMWLKFTHEVDSDNVGGPDYQVSFGYYRVNVGCNVIES